MRNPFQPVRYKNKLHPLVRPSRISPEMVLVMITIVCIIAIVFIVPRAIQRDAEIQQLQPIQIGE